MKSSEDFLNIGQKPVLIVLIELSIILQVIKVYIADRISPTPEKPNRAKNINLLQYKMICNNFETF